MFRFAIRDVLWLIVVVALAVGLWMERERLIGSNTQYKTTIQTLQEMARASGWSVEINQDTGEVLGAAHPGTPQP